MSAYLAGLIQWGLEASILDQRGNVADHLSSLFCSVCVFFPIPFTTEWSFCWLPVRRARQLMAESVLELGTRWTRQELHVVVAPAVFCSVDAAVEFFFFLFFSCACIDIDDRQMCNYVGSTLVKLIKSLTRSRSITACLVPVADQRFFISSSLLSS